MKKLNTIGFKYFSPVHQQQQQNTGNIFFLVLTSHQFYMNLVNEKSDFWMAKSDLVGQILPGFKRIKMHISLSQYIFLYEQQNGL